jgi:hypothetical protein
MQITVTIRPFYSNDFEGTFPKLALRLRSLCSDLINPEPSLYELAGQVDKLLYRTDGTPLREVLLQRKDDIKTLYKAAQEEIANRNLSEADKLLYRIEDIFEEIEYELKKY